MKSPIHNPNAIRAHIEWLAHIEAGGCAEVRIISAGPAQVGYFDDADALIAAVSSVDAGNVYVGLQPRPMRLLERSPNALAVAKHGASNDEIETISTVLIDVDPTRPPGATKQAATDAEVGHAIGAARAASDWLVSRGFAAPAIAMTGNGAQLIMRVPPTSLDTDDRDAIEFGLKLFEAEVRAFVGSLEVPVRVDRTSDLARVAKLIGTVSRKGDGIGDRPHRASHWVEMPGGAPDSALVRHIVDLGMDELRRIDDERQARLEELRVREASEPHRSSAGASPTERCRRYLDKTGTAVEGKGGSGTALRAARIIFHGFGLDEAEGWPIFCEWNRSKASPPFEESERGRPADSLRRKMLEAIRKPLPAEFGWTEVGELRWRAQPRASARTSRGQRAASKGGSNDREGNVAVDTAMNEDDETTRAHSNVRQGPWEGSNGSAPIDWRLPEEPFAGTMRSPTVQVPAPENWTSVCSKEPACVDVLPANMAEMKDVTSFGVAERLLEQIDQFHEAFVFDGGQFWIYRDGIYVRLPDWWIKRSLQLYHGARSVQQLVGASDGTPWFSTATNIASAMANLKTFLEARQASPDGRSFFTDSPALAVFGGKTLIWNKATRQVLLAQNSPEWHATFAYPFEFDSNVVEPQHLLRIMREDMFAGVDPEETELRILRIRQQMGLGMLGAQPLTNLHNVLVMLGQGHDGKSTILGMLRQCMPPGSVKPMHPQDLSSGIGDGAEARADLHGLFAIICDDVSARSMRDSSAYKTVTAYGSVRGRHFGSGVNSFDVNVRATWLLACQELWQTTDKTRGFQRRHCIVEFPNSIPDGEADGALREKLLALEQREIVLWCVHAALALLAGGKLAEPACSARLMRAWMLGDDDVASFLEANTRDCSNEPESTWPKTEELWKAYTAWVSWVNGSGKSTHANQSHFSRRARLVKGVKIVVSGKAKASHISRRLGAVQ